MTGRTTYPTSPMAPVAAPAPAFHPQLPVLRSPEPNVRRQTAVVVVTLAAALLAVIGVLVIGHPGRSGRTLSLPATAGNYVRISTVNGAHIGSIVGSNGTFGSIPTSDVLKARIGLYGPTPSSPPTALFIGFAGSDSPTIGRQLRSENASQVTADVLAGAHASPSSVAVDAGPLGGSLRCSALAVAGLTAEVGVWADSDTLGLVLLFDPAMSASLAQTGGVTREFRASAEH